MPIVVGFVTYGICKEMQGVQGIGKRKRAVIVHRSAEGEYSTVPAAPRPGDGHEELEPEPVPVRIDVAPLGAAVAGRQPGELADGLPPGQPLIQRGRREPGHRSPAVGGGRVGAPETGWRAGGCSGPMGGPSSQCTPDAGVGLHSLPHSMVLLEL